ncbi:MAG TPA: hypothetical protein VIY68_07670 [Steroidobacteraceae bacterium]
MGNDRRVEVNRHNALKSTGPRSAAGKKRASRNSFRHGLSVTAAPSATKRIATLARQIAGRNANATLLQAARSIAAAALDLAQIRRIKLALIERALALEELERSELSNVDRIADAVRRALPELVKLDRYERRAALQRDRSLPLMAGRG